MTDKDKQIAPAQAGGVTTRKHSVGVAGLHARLKNPVRSQRDPDTCPNRLILMLDVSGSMSGEKIVALRDACTGFVNGCNYNDTAVGIEPFGDDYPSPNRLALTTMHPILLTTIQQFHAEGGTPMSRAMDFVLSSYPLTRGIIVSDGEPDDSYRDYKQTFEAANNFRDARIPIDCVHIGSSQGGEHCLRHIAETTGGQYIKFTDVSSFSRSFKYLTPGLYGQLTSGAVDAKQLGAKEIS